MNYRLLLFVTLYTITISGIGIDLYAPSLPAIAQYMDASNSLVKITISTYLFGFALGQIVFGTWSDIYGRRRVLLIGLLLFIISSALGSLAQNIYVLMLLRAVQGFSAASCSVIPKALLSDTLSGKKLAIAASYLTIVWATGPILAPIIGGYLQYYFNWQSNFYFYTIYTTILFIIVWFFLEETHQHKISLQIRPIFQSYYRILSNKIFVGGVISLGLGYSLIIVFNIVGPFLIQNTLGYTSVVYGHVALFIGAAYFVGTLCNRFFIQQFTANQAIKVGLSIMLLASLVLLLFAYTLKLSILVIAMPIFIIVMAAGLVFPNCMARCISLFPTMGGIASALLGCLFVLITMVTSTGVSFLHSSTLEPVAWVYTLLVVSLILIYCILLQERPELANRVC